LATEKKKSALSFINLEHFYIKDMDSLFPRFNLTEASSLLACQELLRSQSYHATTLPIAAPQPEAVERKKK